MLRHFSFIITSEPSIQSDHSFRLNFFIWYLQIDYLKRSPFSTHADILDICEICIHLKNRPVVRRQQSQISHKNGCNGCEPMAPPCKTDSKSYPLISFFIFFFKRLVTIQNNSSKPPGCFSMFFDSKSKYNSFLIRFLLLPVIRGSVAPTVSCPNWKSPLPARNR